jgi:hypothetical protein
MKDIKENYISHVLCNLGSIFMIHNEHFIKISEMFQFYLFMLLIKKLY